MKILKRFLALSLIFGLVSSNAHAMAGIHQYLQVMQKIQRGQGTSPIYPSCSLGNSDSPQLDLSDQEEVDPPQQELSFDELLEKLNLSDSDKSDTLLKQRIVNSHSDSQNSEAIQTHKELQSEHLDTVTVYSNGSDYFFMQQLEKMIQNPITAKEAMLDLYKKRQQVIADMETQLNKNAEHQALFKKVMKLEDIYQSIVNNNFAQGLKQTQEELRIVQDIIRKYASNFPTYKKIQFVLDTILFDLLSKDQYISAKLFQLSKPRFQVGPKQLQIKAEQEELEKELQSEDLFKIYNLHRSHQEQPPLNLIPHESEPVVSAPAVIEPETTPVHHERDKQIEKLEQTVHQLLAELRGLKQEVRNEKQRRAHLERTNRGYEQMIQELLQNSNEHLQALEQLKDELVPISEEPSEIPQESLSARTVITEPQQEELRSGEILNTSSDYVETDEEILYNQARVREREGENQDPATASPEQVVITESELADFPSDNNPKNENTFSHQVEGAQYGTTEYVNSSPITTEVSHIWHQIGSIRKKSNGNPIHRDVATEMDIKDAKKIFSILKISSNKLTLPALPDYTQANYSFLIRSHYSKFSDYLDDLIQFENMAKEDKARGAKMYAHLMARNTHNLKKQSEKMRVISSMIRVGLKEQAVRHLYDLLMTAKNEGEHASVVSSLTDIAKSLDQGNEEELKLIEIIKNILWNNLSANYFDTSNYENAHTTNALKKIYLM